MYALIEGGTTWADLQGYLQKHHPNLRAGITWSPPGTGVVASCLCYGMFDLGMLGGTGEEFINGLEVVLGSGELVKKLFLAGLYDKTYKTKETFI